MKQFLKHSNTKIYKAPDQNLTTPHKKEQKITEIIPQELNTQDHGQNNDQQNTISDTNNYSSNIDQQYIDDEEASMQRQYQSMMQMSPTMMNKII